MANMKSFLDNARFLNGGPLTALAFILEEKKIKAKERASQCNKQ
jgi:hypothetical protein